MDNIDTLRKRARLLDQTPLKEIIIKKSLS